MNQIPTPNLIRLARWAYVAIVVNIFGFWWESALGDRPWRFVTVICGSVGAALAIALQTLIWTRRAGATR